MVSPRRRRWPLALASGALGVGFGAAVAWAGLTVLRPAEDPLASTRHTFVAVELGEVGASMMLNTLARWDVVPVGVNRTSGVVTRVAVNTGDDVKAGDVLYEVELRPVVVAQGSVPAFRPIGARAEGTDVAQLQKMLRSLGFYRGKVDARAGTGTVTAIRAWQKSMGVKQTGTVEAGDVIFVPTLPTRISLDPALIRSGMTLAGGEEAVRGLSAAPVFTIPVTEIQAGMAPAGTRVEVTSPRGDLWQAQVSGWRRDEEGSGGLLVLEAAGGGVVCGGQCGQIEAMDEVSLPSRIVTAETVSGLVVPSAALVSRADGRLAVIGENGEEIAVSVVASARGLSVVTGVAEGTRVRVPASAGQR